MQQLVTETVAIRADYRTAAGRTLFLYYAATAVFLLLDFVLGFNMRLAFLEPWPAARVAYYVVCFACLATIAWRPAFAELIGAFESLVTLVALILSMGVRTMLTTETVLETGTGYVTLPEILNFLMSGGIAYVAWVQGVKRLMRQSGV